MSLKILFASLLLLNAFVKQAEGQTDSSISRQFIISFDPVRVCFGEFSLCGEYFFKPDKSLYASAGIIIPYSQNKLTGHQLFDIPSPYMYKGEVFRLGYLEYHKRKHSHGFHGVNLLGKYVKVDSLLHAPGAFGGSFHGETEENRRLLVGRFTM